MLYFKSCPRCKGDVNVDSDSYGTYARCLQCGFARDLPSKNLRKTGPEGTHSPQKGHRGPDEIDKAA